MSILTYAIWLVAFISAFALGVSFLPEASQYPVSQEIYDSISILWNYLNIFNQIFPIDTLLDILYYSIILKILIWVVWPVIMWLVGIVTKANP